MSWLTQTSHYFPRILSWKLKKHLSLQNYLFLKENHDYIFSVKTFVWFFSKNILPDLFALLLLFILCSIQFSHCLTKRVILGIVFWNYNWKSFWFLRGWSIVFLFAGWQGLEKLNKILFISCFFNLVICYSIFPCHLYFKHSFVWNRFWVHTLKLSMYFKTKVGDNWKASQIFMLSAK